jgi:hypothetical protein
MVASSSLAVLALVAAGSFTLGASVGGVTQRITAAAGISDPEPTATATVTTQASPSRSAKPRKSRSKTPAASKSATVVDTMVPASYLHGRAVDVNGKPVRGLYVLPGLSGRSAFSSDGSVAAVTDARGRFTIPCPHAPVLLSTWRLNTPNATRTIGARWAATYVGGSQRRASVPACGTDTVTTTVRPGATLTGTVRVAGTCPDATFPLWVWLDKNRTLSVRITGLRDGDTFRYSGLPAGTHVLGAKGLTSTLTMAAGGAVERDAGFSCPVTTPTGSPSPTPTEDGSGSPTPTPTGSDSPSSSPLPVPSGTKTAAPGGH